jgi:hypothetical protein
MLNICISIKFHIVKLGPFKTGKILKILIKFYIFSHYVSDKKFFVFCFLTMLGTEPRVLCIDLLLDLLFSSIDLCVYFFFNLIFFCGSGVWTQGLMLPS